MTPRLDATRAQPNALSLLAAPATSLMLILGQLCSEERRHHNIGPTIIAVNRSLAQHQLVSQPHTFLSPMVAIQ